MESGIRRYQRIAPLFIILGLALVFLTSLLLFLYRSPVDAYAQILFVPIMIGAIYFGKKGGILSAVFSTVVYVLLIYLLTEPESLSLIFVKIVVYLSTYFIMGIAGGILFERLKAEVAEIEERVLIDRSTGLYTTRYFITSIQKEIDRAKRYKEKFSIVIFELKEAADASKKRVSGRVMRKLADGFRKQARIVDTIAVCDLGVIGVVLPEIGEKGCQGFVNRITKELEPLLKELYPAASEAAELKITSYVYPDEEKLIKELIDKYATRLEVSYIKSPQEH